MPHQDFGGAYSLLKSTGIDEMKLEIRCLEGTAPLGDGHVTWIRSAAKAGRTYMLTLSHLMICYLMFFFFCSFFWGPAVRNTSHWSVLYSRAGGLQKYGEAARIYMKILPEGVVNIFSCPFPDVLTFVL